VADLHSTSSDQGNFVVVPEPVSNHAVIKALQLPVVVDIDKYLRGTLLSYYHDQGYVSFAFEGGMIGTESVYQLHTSGIWEILDKAGCISHHDHEIEDHYANHLHGISRTLPDKVKVLYRESIQAGDGFRMLPGFHNFMPVRAGQQLAVNHKGNITAPVDGLIFMPLYQAEGNDGFFIVQPVGESDLVNEGTLKP
jgi:succinylglutamate desuccinylase